MLRPWYLLTWIGVAAGCGEPTTKVPDAGVPDAPPAVDSALEVRPATPLVTVPLGLPTDTPFTCVRTATGETITATWSLDADTIGTIAATGVFSANAERGGRITVTCADDAGVMASTQLTVRLYHLQDEGVPDAEKDMLRNSTPTADDWKILYPYDETIFPRNIPSPELHVSPGTAVATAYYVHAETEFYEFEGFFPAATPARLKMAQVGWDGFARSVPNQRVAFSVTKLAGTETFGPLVVNMRIADAKLHGAIYYATYDSPIANSNGAVLRTSGDFNTPELVSGGCTTCHSVSADGTTLAAANHSGPGGTFDLATGTATSIWQNPEEAAFPALFPRGGQVFVQNAVPGQGWPPNTPGSSGTTASKLFLRDGTPVLDSGIESTYAQTPAFSLDGTMLAFTNRTPTETNGQWPGGLGLFNYDAATKKFSGFQSLATPPAGRQYAWPSFTPQNDWLIFQDGVGEDLATWSGNTGRLKAMSLADRSIHDLAALNGDAYVPAGARDIDKNYMPSAQPFPSGGYIWVAFVSRRTYGNILTGTEDATKRIWVAAIDATITPGTDPSHPAFYLGGQELTSGNTRPQWAMLPGKADGAACETGDECAGGYCRADVCSSSAGGTCAAEYERCTAASDCCDAAQACVFGYCARTTP
jgi:hypothetical protein